MKGSRCSNLPLVRRKRESSSRFLITRCNSSAPNCQSQLIYREIVLLCVCICDVDQTTRRSLPASSFDSQIGFLRAPSPGLPPRFPFWPPGSFFFRAQAISERRQMLRRRRGTSYPPTHLIGRRNSCPANLHFTKMTTKASLLFQNNVKRLLPSARGTLRV